MTMKKIVTPVDIQTLNIPLPFTLEETIFFDIETTGFTARNSQLYLIGLIRQNPDSNTFEAIQFFNDDGDEKALLCSFFEEIGSYKNLIHFNGNNFDIPFVLAKVAQCGLEYNFDFLESFDLYRECSKYKLLFKTENLKQKTLEQFFGLHREDPYSGGELIQFYQAYRKNFSRKTEDMLFLHNREDLEGMLTLLAVYAYTAIFDGHFQLERYEFCDYRDLHDNARKEFLLYLKLPFSVKKRVSMGNEDGYFTISENVCKLRIPAFAGELKFFYPNYKDYYYLPEEDIALHKSVASYVDKKYRTQAKASTCYARKTGIYLPCSVALMEPYFLKEYGDSTYYFEANDKLLDDNIMLNRYALHLLRRILNHL